MFSKLPLYLILTLIIYSCESKKKYSDKQMILRQKETTPATFISLVIMRLIYGLAHSMGLSDRLSEFLGGAFVPPGAEDDYDFDDFDY